MKINKIKNKTKKERKRKINKESFMGKKER